ncbi:MAG: 2-isopropylmalate synthase [Deltaproteobacteria bacterium]|nr:2-isopropylmalate synthase [Deltaproteobacteria bacterium]
MTNRVYIFDTTLRDGEQSPGATMNQHEKLQLARQLERLGVDTIEAGFPASSEGDREAVARISSEIKTSRVVGLARSVAEDIETAWSAVEKASKPGIHTFIATSDIHLKHKLRMSRNEVVDRAAQAVRLARSLSDWVEFSCEDATRSDRSFLIEVIEAAIKEGASTINIPDTVGYSYPTEISDLITFLRGKTKGIDKVILSIHCHDDLGLAVANSLAGVEAGVRQVECTINGIGERAGNASLEEIVMALKTRQDHFNLTTGISTEQIFHTSRLVTAITGIPVQPNKAIVGANAFAHESGIHQDGVIKERSTYEIMDPESVGISKSSLVLGKHSGRHAFRERMQALGYSLTDDEVNLTFKRFKDLADRKKIVYDEDLEAIVAEEVLRTTETYKLLSVTMMSGTEVVPTATVKMMVEGEECHGAELGNGPVDATYNAILKLTGRKPKLLHFAISAITGGTDALGEASIRLEENGNVAVGKGAHEDILVASAKAMVNALNRLAYMSRSSHPSVRL